MAIVESSLTEIDSLDSNRSFYSLNWAAIFGGLFVGVLVYLILMSAGLAFGAGEASDVIGNSESARGLGTGAGIWVLVSVLISLFAGSYAAGRVSGLISTRVGYVQGGVVAALFFMLMITQAGMVLGVMSSGVSALRSVVGGSAQAVLGSERLNGIVEDAVGDLQLKSSPDTIASGLLSRLLRGDRESAVNYLAAQSGISPDEARSRLQTLSTNIQNAATDIAQKTANMVKSVGWASFAAMLFGTFCAMLGGGFGAQMNMRHSVDRLDRRLFRRPAYM